MSDEQIAYPVVKTATALGAGAGTSVISTMTAQAGSFLPTDLGGWMALIASCMALLYSLHLMVEFYWLRVFRPWFISKGWVKKPKGTTFEVDGDGNVTRVNS